MLSSQSPFEVLTEQLLGVRKNNMMGITNKKKMVLILSIFSHT